MFLYICIKRKNMTKQEIEELAYKLRPNTKLVLIGGESSDLKEVNELYFEALYILKGKLHTDLFVIPCADLGLKMSISDMPQGYKFDGGGRCLIDTPPDFYKIEL